MPTEKERTIELWLVDRDYERHNGIQGKALIRVQLLTAEKLHNILCDSDDYKRLFQCKISGEGNYYDFVEITPANIEAAVKEVCG